MLKAMIFAAAATVLTAGSAWAQSNTYYGPDGQIIGRAQTYGGSTTYYNPSNQPIGSARRTR
jgi:hypothetical protein